MVTLQKRPIIMIMVSFNRKAHLIRLGNFMEFGPAMILMVIKITVGKYMDGKKVGKWFFWTKDNVIKEVDYDNSKITSVNE